MQPEIIYEDEGLLAVSKPAGLLVHAIKNKKESEPTLVNWLLERYPEIGGVGDDPAFRPGIVHRLDKDTSGVIVVARSQASFERLKSLFQDREMEKTYLALATGHTPPRGRIETPIGIENGSTKRSTRSLRMAKAALTEYDREGYFERTDGFKSSLLKVRPLTGRTHQIRVHLASIGHPVLGDRLYARRKPQWVSRLMLHALSIEFETAPGRRLKLEAPPDEAFMAVLKDAGGRLAQT